MMVDNTRVRWSIIFGVLLMAMVWVAPTIFRWGDQWWFTKDKIVYGLDIQGGLHLVLGVDMEDVLNQNTRNLAASLPEELQNEHAITVTTEVDDGVRGRMRIKLARGDQEKINTIEEFLGDRYLGQLQVLGSSASEVEIQYLELYRRSFRDQVVERSIETIRNRIDEFGVSEPQISAQGEDRILVQLPGIEDSQRAKDLINQTAMLDFAIVSTEADPFEVQTWIDEAEAAGGFALGKDGLSYSQYVTQLNEALADRLPPDTQVLFERAPGVRSLEAGKIPYLLSKTETVSGALLRHATAAINPQTGGPIVNFSFNPEGAREFGAMTSANVNERMAIVLDNVIQSAPNIESAITAGSGMITMGRSDNRTGLQEAELIAMALRSGALPAKLDQLEERTVGPTLGADAVRKGQMAGLIGAGLVLLFVLFYYKSFGVVTSIAILFNVLIILALLAALGATLTLPGVAGIALTIGMAVDANVIINERIKEELRKGVNLQAAIREGYGKAFSAIMDGNLTTIAVCAVLMYFGTGPIRGFAITLLVGLIASMFTSIFFSRTLVDFLVQRLKLRLSI